MKRPQKRFWERLGPGFITGAADDDPSGIATYSQTGAVFGLQQLWMVLLTFPLMLAVQEMCGRIGTVTGEGLAGIMRKFYARPFLVISVGLLLAANILNIGANLGAMAAALQLLTPLPFVPLLVGITALTLFLEVFVSYPRYAQFLKWLTISLFAYVVTAFVVTDSWREVFVATLHPTLEWSKPFFLNIVALLGTTISPYLFFWQADQEVEEAVAHGTLLGFGIGKPRVNKKMFKDLWIDTGIGMLFSNMVMWFIIVTSAATLGKNGIFISTATEAALALRPIAGEFAFLLFAVGIIGTGLLSVPILAGSASYAVAEACGWKGGLYRKLRDAKGFYGVIIGATLVGLLVNLFHIPSFTMLYYSAVANGIVAPILILFILFIANNKKIMGAHTNRLFSNVMGILAAALMFFAAAGFLFLL